MNTIKFIVAMVVTFAIMGGVYVQAGYAGVARNEAAGVYVAEERQGGPAYLFNFQRTPTMDREVSVVPYYSTDTPIRDIQVVYANPVLVYCSVPGNIDLTNELSTNATTLTIGACVEYPPGVFSFLTFGGSKYGACPTNATLTSDSLPISIPPHAQFKIRTYVQSANAPAGYVVSMATLPTGYSDMFGYKPISADCLPGSNNVTYETMTNIPASGGVYTFCYTPSAVIGSGVNVSLAFIGDSISVTSATTSNQYYFQGFLSKAAGISVPSINMAYFGNTLANELSSSNPHLLLVTNCTHVICNLGINDLQAGTTFAEMTNLYLQMWNYWASNGLKIYQTTMPPHTSSTDGWITTDNQGSPGTPDWPTNRTAINDWIRSCPTPLSGCLDIASALETNGLWKVGSISNYYTVDGLHPSAFGETIIADIVSDFIYQLTGATATKTFENNIKPPFFGTVLCQNYPGAGPPNFNMQYMSNYIVSWNNQSVAKIILDAPLTLQNESSGVPDNITKTLIFKSCNESNLNLSFPTNWTWLNCPQYTISLQVDVQKVVSASQTNYYATACASNTSPDCTTSPQPITTTNNWGDSILLSVGLYGPNPLDFQWYFSGTNVDTGTNSTLSISNLTQAYFGNYYVIVSNSTGSLASSIATIFVPPTIITQPSNVVVSNLSPATFSVSAIGYPSPNAFQWTLNSTNFVGSNTASLTIPSVSLAATGIYQVQVSNSVGTAVSGIATLNMSPSITAPFLGATPIWGRATTIQVGVVGNGTLSYQWYLNGVPIPGATDPEITFPSIQFTNSGLYSVVINSPFGTVTNEAELVSVSPAVVSLGFYPGLTICGAPGDSYSILTSGDLGNATNWSTIVTNFTLTQTKQLWIDTNVDASSPFYSKYFYKLIPLQ